MVGYVTRYRRNVRLLKFLLEEKYFGQVHRFAYQFGTNGGWAPFAGYAANSGRRRAGVLAISGSHFLDRMLWFWGYPVEMAYVDDGENGPEANCVATFRFAGGLTGSLRCSKTAVLPGGLVLDTDIGCVVLPEDDQADILFLPSRSQHLKCSLRSLDATGDLETDPFLSQISDFVSVCRTGRSFGCDALQGAASIRLIEDLYARRQTLRQDWYSPRDKGESR